LHPTIRDRVVQTAAKLLLEPIFEADLDLHLWLSAAPGGTDAIKACMPCCVEASTDVVDADLSK
jgi:RNA-directed DNA polymerase